MASTIHHFVSHDGTRLGYRKTGNGAPLIIVHGAGRISQNYLKLAGYLASFFTVYIYDRRGRGLSGAITPDHSIQKETEDLEALIKETGAKYVFGHSFGGLVALQTALKGEVERLLFMSLPLLPFRIIGYRNLNTCFPGIKKRKPWLFS
jgi:pimeloyl-ACP methyl ester carboxylesterase